MLLLLALVAPAGGLKNALLLCGDGGEVDDGPTTTKSATETAAATDSSSVPARRRDGSDPSGGPLSPPPPTRDLRIAWWAHFHGPGEAQFFRPARHLPPPPHPRHAPPHLTLGQPLPTSRSVTSPVPCPYRQQDGPHSGVSGGEGKGPRKLLGSGTPFPGSPLAVFPAAPGRVPARS